MSEPETLPFRSMTVGTFLDKLASAEPVPGGGSASAVTAAIAASLVAMVAALSVDRPAYAAHTATHGRAGAAGRDLAGRLARLADEDAAAFAGFAAAMKMARATDEEKASRAAAIRTAARAAAEVPLRTLEACREVAAAAEALAGRSNRNAQSDLAVASRLAESAAHGAAENVMVNLPSMGDDEAAERLGGRVAELLAEVEDLAESARAYVEAGEPRDPEPTSPA
jgi:methenyltetrahydrofolate cyclohydrolase